MYISIWKLLHVPCLSPRHATCLSISRKCVTRKNHKYDLLYSKYSWFEAWATISIFKISMRKGDDYGEMKKKGVLITSSHPFLQWTNQKCIKAVTFPVGTSSFQSCSQIPLRFLWSLGRPDHKICLPSLPSHSKLSVPSDAWNSGWVKSYTPCTVIHIT